MKIAGLMPECLKEAKMPVSPAELLPHGTLDYSELRTLGLRPEELTHFSSNINPFGPPPSAVAALQAAISAEMVARYPDRLCLDLREELARYHNLTADSILVGNGSADLIWLVGLLYLQRRRVAILGPTFGEYRNISQVMQAEIHELPHPGWIGNGLTYTPAPTTIEDVTLALHELNPEVIFICNPNNPTGTYLGPDDMDTLYAAAPRALWIIDEAYAEFMQPAVTTVGWIERGNWIVLRSMTKDFALGGLRLGYLVGPPALVKTLQTTQPPWNVNTFAQLAGLVSLREGIEWRDETIAKLLVETASLQNELRVLGFQPRPTKVSYFLVPVESPVKLRRALLEHRLVIRDCTSFGLPNFIRLATQLPQANQRLLAALRQLAPAMRSLA